MVLLMLIPLLAPSESGTSSMSQIAQALGLAAVKAAACIVAIMAGGFGRVCFKHVLTWCCMRLFFYTLGAWLFLILRLWAALIQDTVQQTDLA